MEFTECIEGRSSCRAFLKKEIEKEVLERIISAANRSPSYMNTQPWEVFVCAGEKKTAIASKLFEEATRGKAQNPHFPFPREWPEAMERRAREHRLRRFRAVGVDPENREQVRENFLRNFHFFDAPCVLFVGMDRTLSPWSVFDLGLFVHGILLSAHSEGLGACPQAMPTAYPEIIKEELNIPEGICIVIAISIGYPDRGNIVNMYRSTRRELSEFVRWYGF